MPSDANADACVVSCRLGTVEGLGNVVELGRVVELGTVAMARARIPADVSVAEDPPRDAVATTAAGGISAAARRLAGWPATGAPIATADNSANTTPRCTPGDQRRASHADGCARRGWVAVTAVHRYPGLARICPRPSPPKADRGLHCNEHSALPEVDDETHENCPR